MAASLAERLHALHVEHLIRAAETIRDWPTNYERLEQAQRHIREAILNCTLGRITLAEESVLFSLLSFAMPEPDQVFDGSDTPR